VRTKEVHEMAFSPGECNCCGELGRLVFLAALHDGTVFLACNSCASASKASDFDGHWLADGTQAIEEFAPRGFRAATEAEVAAQGYDPSRLQHVNDDELELFP
jgi:hypothetical protein